MKTDSTPRSVVLLSGGPPISLKVLYCLKRMGVSTDVIDIGRPSAVRHSRYRRRYVRIPKPDLRDDASVRVFVNSLNDHLTRYAIQGVVPGDIASTSLLHVVRQQLHGVVVFPTSDAQTLDLLDDKWRFQRFLEDEGLPVPKGVLLENLDKWPEELRSMRFPLIVKTLFGESGHGVATVHDLGDLERYLRSGSKYSRMPLLLQEYASGVDADISILAVEGEIKCHVVQSRRDGCALEFVSNECALGVVDRIVQRLKFSGVANFDLRIEDETGGVTVIECNPRFWYTLQASLWRGLNFAQAGLRCAQGEDVNNPNLVGGRYYLHGCLIKEILWKPQKWGTIEGYNMRGLFQALSDPMPFLRSSK
ncbi:ATP-grasp domain-containing protein [Thioalkalivibrio sp. ALE12]|uniref:ATP-grasp domain-containing protein n=1 Tax=Thioalkalivibrio sp. ALE12 TaxID=1158170 RepID=UPI0009DB359B|nr:ATP-grasp domain-containing protein [Thioalkalivibrio sp. ALE12]